MKTRIFAVAIVSFAVAGMALLRAAKGPAPADSNVVRQFVLPTAPKAKVILNSTPRHREWVTVPVGSSNVLAFIVYPERSDKAPVVMLSSRNQGASAWIRAVADQVAEDGFIAVVPDVLTGLGPKDGDSDAFLSGEAVAEALGRLGSEGIARRIDAVRQYALRLLAADVQSASLELDTAGARIEATIEKLGKHARFELT